MHEFLKPKETLIVAHGERPTLDLLHTYRAHATLTIALDGACNQLLEQNVVPDLVIGDLDSVDSCYRSRVKTIYCSDQNSNDLEKALHYCVENNLKSVSVLGAFGQRIDHFLTNIYVMKKFAQQASLVFADEQQCAFIVPTDQTLYYALPIGSYVSFFPLDSEVGPIESMGVDYPLNHETLLLSSRIGTLNRVSSPCPSIHCVQGTLLMMVPNVFFSGHENKAA